MFIGVCPYGSRTTRVSEKILVLDTEDLTVEYIQHNEIDLCTIIGLNDYSYANRPRTYSVRSLHTEQLHSGALRRFDFIKSASDPNDIFIFDNKAKVSLYRPDFSEGGARESLVVNDTTIHRSLLFAFLQYVFRYREYYILRFLCSCSSGTDMFWMSVALSNQGSVKAYWNRDFTISENEDLGRKVDILSCI